MQFEKHYPSIINILDTIRNDSNIFCDILNEIDKLSKKDNFENLANDIIFFLLADFLSLENTDIRCLTHIKPLFRVNIKIIQNLILETEGYVLTSSDELSTIRLLKAFLMQTEIRKYKEYIMAETFERANSFSSIKKDKRKK